MGGIITPFVMPAGIPLKVAIKLRDALEGRLVDALPYHLRPSSDSWDSDDDDVLDRYAISRALVGQCRKTRDK